MENRRICAEIRERVVHNPKEHLYRNGTSLAVAVDLKSSSTGVKSGLPTELCVQKGTSLAFNEQKGCHVKERLPCNVDSGSLSPNYSLWDFLKALLFPQSFTT